MARPVLARLMSPRTLVALALAGLLAACGSGGNRTGSTASVGALACTGDLSKAPGQLQKAYPSFQRRIQAGPFYHVLEQQLGQARSCTRSVQAGALRIAYEFPRNGTLVAQTDPRIEFSEQRVNLQGLDEDEAKRLLQAAEANAFGATGCGLDWEHHVIEEPGTFGGSQEVVYRGDACNCQARVLYDDEKVIGLVLRSAC
jgi:hypothetical protein